MVSVYWSGLLAIYLHLDCCVYCLINNASAIHLLSQHLQCQGAQLGGNASLEANLLWRCCTFWGAARNKRKRSTRRIIYHMTHMPVFYFPLFFRGWSVFIWAHGWACYGSEVTDLEHRPVGITNLSLISKIVLEMAAEENKFILKWVSNYRTNRNVYLSLNKSRGRDLCRRKKFDIFIYLMTVVDQCYFLLFLLCWLCHSSSYVLHVCLGL